MPEAGKDAVGYISPMNPAIRLILFGAAFLAGGITTSLGALIVDWGGNYVTASTVPFSNLNGTSTQYGGFSGGNPILLSPSSGYSGTSATFYGQATVSGSFSGSTGITNDALNGDRIEIKQNSQAISAVFLWKQTDFLNGLNGGTLNLAAGSSIGGNVVTYASGVPGRAVLRLGSIYYISQSVFTGTGAFSADLTTLNWFDYDPATSLTTIGSAANIFTGGQISNVTEVGYFTGVTNGASNAVRVSSVEFNAIAVPEPAAAVPALLGTMGILLWLRRR